MYQSNKISFDYIKISLASPMRIREWASRILSNGEIVGEVQRPETVNYRNLRPEVGGLFCEKIFGPIKNFECACGKYKNGETGKYSLVCDRCQVEVTASRVRRHRMGYIELVSPVTHFWYLKGIPSYLSLLLTLKRFTLMDIIYFRQYLIFGRLSEDSIENDSVDDSNFEDTWWFYEDELYFPQQSRPHVRIGSEAIDYLLKSLDLSVEVKKTRLLLMGSEDDPSLINITNEVNESNAVPIPTRARLIRRIRILENFLATESNPSWLVLKVLPIIPPGLRPMVQLDGGRFATSDLNELYRRVITRNSRLSRLLKIYAPAIVVHNEKRMLQEAVDALIDNGKQISATQELNSRPLKSLSDIIEGKQGRFRQNLLGKRVDYSGRSVIIVGPLLKLNQCGLPNEIALELFQPFIIHQLIEKGLVTNIRLAKRLIKTGDFLIWSILKSVLAKHPVLLNRAPTLHRLGIQAFEPILVEGRAIKLHPLVCSGFNADFDGDQMAVHVPLSLKAQQEAYKLMLAPRNFLSPATGDPILLPSQDMVLGCYYLTINNPIYYNRPKACFANMLDVLIAYERGIINLHTPVLIPQFKEITLNSNNKPIPKFFKTTPGRIFLNRLILRNAYLDK